MKKSLFAGVVALGLTGTIALAQQAYQSSTTTSTITPAPAPVYQQRTTTETTTPAMPTDPRVFDPTRSSTYRMQKTVTADGQTYEKTESTSTTSVPVPVPTQQTTTYSRTVTRTDN